MASAGKEYLIWLTTNGLVGGTQVALDYQNDTDFNTGKDINTVMFKQDQAWTAQSTKGASLEVDILAAEPLGTAAALVMDAHNNGTDVYMYFQTAKTGGQRWHGKYKVAITTQGAKVSDPSLLHVKFGQSGIVNQATV